MAAAPQPPGLPGTVRPRAVVAGPGREGIHQPAGGITTPRSAGGITTPRSAGRNTIPRSAVDLYWLPLGAGGSALVRLNGRIYERIHAWAEHRRPLALYHAALEVRVAGRRSVIELTPVPGPGAPTRGDVREGPVGSRWLGRARIFRYELRCWHDGSIPDRQLAVDSPERLSDDDGLAREVLAKVAEVPMLVWGRDEHRTGEMWNSNAVISWILAASGLPVDGITPPAGGRAPGWDAGLVVAGVRRQPARR